MSSPPESKAPKSAYDSPTFGEDSSFHVEQPIGSMSISPCGRDVVLASKEGLHIIDLDNPYSPPRYLSHRTPWEVADVQWSPFAARDSWVVSTSNQKALVWNLEMRSWQNPIEHVLHAHTRAITDINFSAHHPDVLATCAVDSFVHCWDLRLPAKPVISFSDWFAGATQVKWNRQDSHIIASSHDRFLHIWDDRKGAQPIRTIEAHNTKIYGIDWNRMRPEAVVTCSLDKTIKFWDYSVEGDIPEKVIHTSFSVWRARHTPFGWGVLAMPQRGNSDLHLYSRTSKDEAEEGDEPPLVHSFPGHKGQVKEFLWRPRGTVLDGLDHREFQLVTWGTDRELRLHRVDPEILKGVGYEKGKSFVPSLNLTRKGAVYKTFHEEPREPELLPQPDDGASDSKAPPTRQVVAGFGGISMPYPRRWTQGGPMGQFETHGNLPLRADMNPISWMRGVKVSGWEVETIGDEITHVGERFTRVAFESVNVGQRKATISLHGPWGPDNTNVFLRVDIKFPGEYPKAAVPVYNVQKTSSVTAQLAKTITSALYTVSEAYLSKQRGCLEGILRYLLGEYTVEEIATMIQEASDEPPKSPRLLEDVESSDEDEDVGQYQGNDLALSSSELLRPVNANVMVPVRRVCGALWTNDGRLVCFFPPKEEKVASFLDSIGLREMTRLSRANRVFEAFGRFQTNSPSRKNVTGTGASNGPLTDDGASDYSDNSEESSSSSGSSDFLGALPQHFHLQRTSNLGFSRAKSTDNSQKSTAGISAMRSSTSKLQNTVSIHDFADILPAKKSLAQNYRIQGGFPEICSHNMAVAAGCGDIELSHIWGLIKLVFDGQSPTGKGEVVQTAHAVLSHIKRSDSGVDLTYDMDNFITPDDSNSGIVMWGSHPFGSRWLLPALFEHFDKLGDIQMLGILAFLLSEPRSNGQEDRLSDVHLKSSVSEHIAPPPPMQRGHSNSGTRFVSPAKDGPPISTSYSSACSSADPWPSETPPLYSTGATPPTAVRSGRAILKHKIQKFTTPVSGSPDQLSEPRHLNVGPTLASSLSRSMPNEALLASSPNGNIKKQSSPAGSLTMTAWTGNPFSGKPASAIPDYMHSSTAPTSHVASDTEFDSLAHQKSVKPSTKSSMKSGGPAKSSKKMRVVLKNQEEFDSDCHGVPPLSDQTNISRYSPYRNAYADLLLAWNLPIARREILKMTPLNDGQSLFGYPTHDDDPSASVSFSPKFQAEGDIEGLGLQRHCCTCGSALHISVFARSETKRLPQTGKRPTSPSSLTCPECGPSEPQPRLSCVVCDDLVTGTFTPCLLCGHISCRMCHEQWFATEEAIHSPEQTPTCPGGCGCPCPEHITIYVPFPEIPMVTEEIEDRPMKSNKARRRRNRTAEFQHTGSNWPLDLPHVHEESELSTNSKILRFPSLIRSRSSVNIDRVQLKNATRRWKDTELMDRSIS